MRHALAGVALALLLSVLTAAMAGAFLGDLVAGTYGARVAFYSALLLYVVVGAGVLFVKLAQHEKRPLNLNRVLLWYASLWLWPALLAGLKSRSADTPVASDEQASKEPPREGSAAADPRAKDLPPKDPPA